HAHRLRWGRHGRRRQQCQGQHDRRQVLHARRSTLARKLAALQIVRGSFGISTPLRYHHCVTDAGLLLDALIVLVYFVAITTIGLYMGRRENSLSDFALGGRQMSWWAVIASIIVAETNAATLLGMP